MSDERALDVGLAYKLKLARDRLGIPDNADLDWLAQGDNLLKVRHVRLGGAKIVSTPGFSDPTAIMFPAEEKPKRLCEYTDVWLSSRATKLFSAVKELSEVAEHTLECRSLLGSSTDFRTIKKQLGGEDATVFDSVEELEKGIVQLITTPMWGTLDDFFPGGSAAIFFVCDPQDSGRVVCVSLCWNVNCKQWHVDCADAYSCRWSAGHYVFRPAPAV